MSAAALRQHYREVRERLSRPVPIAPKLPKPAPEPEPIRALIPPVRDYVRPAGRDFLWLGNIGPRSQRLAGLSCPPEVRLTILKILDTHNLTWAAMVQNARFKRIVDCRHAIFVALHKEHGWAFARIGRLMGKDHTTVMHAIQKHDKKVAMTGCE